MNRAIVEEKIKKSLQLSFSPSMLKSMKNSSGADLLQLLIIIEIYIKYDRTPTDKKFSDDDEIRIIAASRKKLITLQEKVKMEIASLILNNFPEQLNNIVREIDESCQNALDACDMFMLYKHRKNYDPVHEIYIHTHNNRRANQIFYRIIDWLRL